MSPAYRIDGSVVSMSDFYRYACDPQRPIVVEACAGAGKTWMLVSRVLRALLEGAPAQSILAITFTRKAAGEMRIRLQEWLQAFASATLAERTQALIQRGMDATEAVRHAERLGTLYADLLSTGKTVRIQTFHGWFAELLRQAPLSALSELGLQPDVSLLEDPAEVFQDVWFEFLASVQQSTTLRDDLRRTIHRWSRAHVQRWLESALDRRIELSLCDAAGLLEGSVQSVVDRWTHIDWSNGLESAWRSWRVKNSLTEAIQVLQASGKKAQATSALGLASALTEEIAEDGLSMAVNALWTQSGSVRKLGNAHEISRAIDVLGELREAMAQQQALDDHQRMVRLARVLLDTYAGLKRRRSLADMADLELCGLHLLKDSEVAAWMQQGLDQRVRYLLVDEFQDTSPLQWQALQSWLSGYGGIGAGAEVPKVFFVGDPKQSIYRFRRAEPRIFLAAQAFVRDVFGGAVLSCDHTRRNAQAVICAVNATFDTLTRGAGYAGFRAHTSDSSVQGEVAVLEQVPRRADTEPEQSTTVWRDTLTTKRMLPEEHLRLTEARQVAQLIERDVASGCAPGDIFVLTRKRSTLRYMAQALRERQIPHLAAEPMPLVETVEVGDLLDLLDVLVSPQHDLALARALRSPIFGCEDVDLLSLAEHARSLGTCWFHALLDESGTPSARLQYAKSRLVKWHKAVQDMPLHDAMNHIVEDGEFRRRYAQAVPVGYRARAIEHLNGVLSASLTLDGARYATPYNFIRTLRRKRLSITSTSSEDAVQLLTIHGAKGLEAEHVYVIDADAQANAAETASLLVEWPAESPHPLRVAFVASISRCPPSLAALRDHERHAQTREEFNALYVAMTRARKQLIFSSTEPFRRSSSGGWLACLDAIPVMSAEAAQRVSEVVAASRAVLANSDDDFATVTVPVLPRRRFASEEDCVASVADNTVETHHSIDGAVVDKWAALLGSVVHRAMELLTSAPTERWPSLRASVVRAAVLEQGATSTLGDRALDIVTQWSCRPELRCWLDRTQADWAANEVTVRYQGQLLRMDRLVRRRTNSGREWWVLDYKLDMHPEHNPDYLHQMRRYASAMSAAMQNTATQEPIRSAFICGEGRFVEVTSMI